MLNVQTARQENFLPKNLSEKILSDENIIEPITFNRGELKYFIAEMKEMFDEGKIILHTCGNRLNS